MTNAQLSVPDTGTGISTESVPAFTPLRIVIDTNVCLDLFMFRDPRWQPLMTALQQGKVQAITRADCKMEWSIVLTYPKLGLDEARRQQINAEFETLIEQIDMPASAAIISLPVCRDPDDQKFLELAHHGQASCLISKDKALLKLARKTLKLGLFQILSPEAWVAAAT